MTRILFLAVAAAGLCLSQSASALADPSDAAVLRLVDAEQMAARAQKAAAELRLDVSVVIVNREGRVILAHRMDGTSIINHALAEKKAVTAAALGVPTSVLEQAVDAGKHSLLSVTDAAMIGGGVPILRGERIIGGVGVSGGSPQDDEKIATSALGSDPTAKP